MKDLLGREIKVGDIVAHGTRSGNGGAISVKVVAAIEMKDARWSENKVEKFKVINYYDVKQEYNKELGKWQDVEPHYEKGGSGWSEGGTVLIVNESVPDDLKEFLRSLI